MASTASVLPDDIDTLKAMLVAMASEKAELRDETAELKAEVVRLATLNERAEERTPIFTRSSSNSSAPASAAAPRSLMPISRRSPLTRSRLGSARSRPSSMRQSRQASHDALLDRARRSPRIWNASTSSSSRLPSLVTVAIASRC
jgi:hypothetical protein